jgi:hypothetical protein
MRSLDRVDFLGSRSSLKEMLRLVSQAQPRLSEERCPKTERNTLDEAATFEPRPVLLAEDQGTARECGLASETRKEVLIRTVVALMVCGVVRIAVGHGRAGAMRGGSHQAQQETQKPAEAQNKADEKQAAKSTNPIKATAESLALGRNFVSWKRGSR